MNCILIVNHNKMSMLSFFSLIVVLQQIQHPTASLIAKVATAQDDITGDGTTSNVLIIGELLKQADLYISEVKHASLSNEPQFYVQAFVLLSDCPPVRPFLFPQNS